MDFVHPQYVGNVIKGVFLKVPEGRWELRGKHMVSHIGAKRSPNCKVGNDAQLILSCPLVFLSRVGGKKQNALSLALFG